MMRKTMRVPRPGGTPRTASWRAARRPRSVGAVAVLAAFSLGAAACSSGGSSSTAATYNPATLQSDISSAYTTLFNLADKNVDAKVAVIQNGSKIRAAMQDALSNPIANSAAGAKVNTVTILSATACQHQGLPSPCAKVTYDILGPATNGSQSAILPNSTGYAVFVDGHWLVAKATICGLLGLFYQTLGKQGSPAGC
jgi:hypothetical protein